MKKKAKKEKAIQKLFEKEDCAKIPAHSPLKKKHSKIDYTSFVLRRSVMIRKLLTDKPATAVAIMKHVFEQEYKHPVKRKLMNKYLNRNVHLAELMLEIGKHKGRKDDVKLLQCVNKNNSLRQACHLADILWTKFHCHTYVKSTCVSCKKGYTCKLSEEKIHSTEDHYHSDNISFLLPDKKYKGERFMRYSLK